MIRSFADRTTADLWAQLSTKAARRIPRALWPVAHRKLTMLDSAQHLEDLAAVQGNRLGLSAGIERANTASGWTNNIESRFCWEKNDAYNVCCEDYH